MCRAFEETRKEGIAQGEERTMLKVIKRLMKSQNLTAKAVMDMLDVPLDEQAGYMEKLNCAAE